MSYPYNQQPTGYPAPIAPNQSTNGMAIASLVTSLLGFGLIGLILGHIALGQIKRTGEGGHGLALAGTIIGWINVIFVLIIVILYIIGIVAFISIGAAQHSTSAFI